MITTLNCCVLCWRRRLDHEHLVFLLRVTFQQTAPHLVPVKCWRSSVVHHGARAVQLLLIWNHMRRHVRGRGQNGNCSQNGRLLPLLLHSLHKLLVRMRDCVVTVDGLWWRHDHVVAVGRLLRHGNQLRLLWMARASECGHCAGWSTRDWTIDHASSDRKSVV